MDLVWKLFYPFASPIEPNITLLQAFVGDPCCSGGGVTLMRIDMHVNLAD
jgi:hypothetical protein